MSVRGWCVSVATAAVMACAAVGMKASGPIGGCPRGGDWQLVIVADFFRDIPPEILAGIPSLDGNGDGFTCVKTVGRGGIAFRDNTVQGPPEL